jgi:hypothetical protein
VRGCTPGKITRWLWFDWPDGEMPAEGDIGIRPSTGSCWMVISIKPSRKGDRWYTMQVEGLGIGAAELGEDGTFSSVPMSREHEEAAAMVENAERLERGHVPGVS